ncbi:MAG: Trk family potassium uptake protein [Lachnospiraceae bacterium]|nr:Trk family potassium uptake protein [Lachnospiraceae bacterium]
MNSQFFGNKLSSFQIIIIGFLSVILAGALLLMLPISSASGAVTPFKDALFTSTSAVCVTGLVVYDTATYWSLFGQAIILILIQLGGLGIISVIAFVATISGRRISLLERSMLQDTLSTHQIGGIVKLVSFVFKVVFAAELIGALIMMPVFIQYNGVSGIWLSIFHSVSALCNAGFDIMGSRTGPFSSLTFFADNPVIVLTICFLIVFGGIGFLTWDDIVTHRQHLHKYRMQSKVILVTTFILIVVPAVTLFFGEFGDHPFGERVLLSLFQSVTPRTAGFNTADLSLLSGPGRSLTIILMLIGGSPGSTAGGIKTTSIAVMFSNARAVFLRKKSATLFSRRLEEIAIRNAFTLLMLYVFLSITGAALISMMDHQPMGACLFETVSAIGTVGLSLGLTPHLGALSHVILILLMFLGRVGGMTMMYAALSTRNAEVSQFPVEKITVG